MFYKTSIRLLLPLLFVCIAAYSYADPGLTDDEVAEILIQESIRNYSGRCPCPYSVMKNGRHCGGNSAYSKPRGKSPLCYREDVSDEMVREWRHGHGKE